MLARNSLPADPEGGTAAAVAKQSEVQVTLHENGPERKIPRNQDGESFELLSGGLLVVLR